MQGNIVEIIGTAVDVQFPRDAVPKVYDAPTITDSGLTLEVQQQMGDGVVRTIAMGSSDGLRRGLGVENTGAPISVPVGAGNLGRIMRRWLGGAVNTNPPTRNKSWPVHVQALHEVTGAAAQAR